MSFPEDSNEDLKDSNGTASETDLFPHRDSLPVADLTDLYLMALLPALVALLVLMFLLICLFCVKCPGEPQSRTEVWEGLTASFFLVVRDVWTCCGESNGEKKPIPDPEPVQLRSARATSVQRQTDTLK